MLRGGTPPTGFLRKLVGPVAPTGGSFSTTCSPPCASEIDSPVTLVDPDEIRRQDRFAFRDNHSFLNTRSAKQLSAEVFVCCELICIRMPDTTNAFSPPPKSFL